MSRWIYLESDLPPTASEGDPERARSQARERKVEEGDPGTSEGWGKRCVGRLLPTPAICQPLPGSSSCLLSRALQPYREVSS